MTNTILAFDIESYSASENTAAMEAKRHAFADLLKKASTAVGSTKIAINSDSVVDIGDGCFVVLDTRDFSIVIRFLLEIETLASNQTDISLRGVLHQGECGSTSSLFTENLPNYVGEGINETARFLDSKPLKDYLKISNERFVFGISNSVYSDIRGQSFVHSSRYFEYAVSVKTFNDSVFLYSSQPITGIDSAITTAKDAHIKESFLHFLDENPIYSLSSISCKEGESIYVFPEFEEDYKVKLGSHIIDSKDFIETFSANPNHSIISGGDQLGKTQFCKEMCRILSADADFLPLFFCFGSKYAGFMKNHIGKAISDQYESLKGSPDFYRKVVIIDDFHLLQPEKQQRILEQLLKTTQTYFILVVDSIYNINIVDRELLDGYNSFEMKEFRPSKRAKLIQKWMNTECIEDSNYKLFDQYKEYVDKTLLTGLIPSTPFNILVILSESRAFNPLSSEITSKGHCYQALIYIAMKKANVPENIYDIFFNFFETVAYELYSAGKMFLSQPDFDAYLEEYGSKYNQPLPNDVFIQHLRASRIFTKNTIGEFHFSDKYVYFFFIAKYLADNKDSDDIKDQISEIYANLQVDENGYIGVFLVHHIKDEDILDEIQLNLMCLYDTYTEVTLDQQEIEFLTKHESHLVEATINAQNNSAANRQQELLEQDRQEEKNKQTDDMPASEVDSELNSLRRAIKTAEVMGQILRSRTGSFKRDKQKEYFREAMNVFLRVSGRFLEDFRTNKEDFIEYFENRIKQFDKAKMGRQERFELAMKYYSNFNALNYISSIVRISSSLCSEPILGIVEELCQEIDNPISELVSLQCRMWYGKSIPSQEVAQIRSKHNEYSYQLAKYLVSRYCDYHNVSYKDKQRLSNLLGIKLKSN